jgi:hypothetical protein
MDKIDNISWQSELVNAITHAHFAHSEFAKSPDDKVRFHDHLTPYLVHPLWCAVTLLQEPRLPIELRRRGYVALLWHDTLEDTNAPLPLDTSVEIAQLVQKMTFSSFDEERIRLWECHPEVRLLKLYDKISNLLDGTWMKEEKWNVYVDHALKLTADVEGNFGDLNIVKISKSIAKRVGESNE